MPYNCTKCSELIADNDLYITCLGCSNRCHRRCLLTYFPQDSGLYYPDPAKDYKWKCGQCKQSLQYVSHYLNLGLSKKKPTENPTSSPTDIVHEIKLLRSDITAMARELKALRLEMTDLRKTVALSQKKDDKIANHDVPKETGQETIATRRKEKELDNESSNKEITAIAKDLKELRREMADLRQASYQKKDDFANRDVPTETGQETLATPRRERGTENESSNKEVTAMAKDLKVHRLDKVPVVSPQKKDDKFANRDVPTEIGEETLATPRIERETDKESSNTLQQNKVYHVNVFRQLDIIIKNLPEYEGEYVKTTVQQVARALNIKLEHNEILRAERVGLSSPRNKKCRDIWFRLTKFELYDTLLKNAQNRRGGITSADIGMTGAPQRFYVNERHRTLKIRSE